MATLDLQIDVAAPLDLTYVQWTRLDALGVITQLDRLDETHLRGRMRVAGVEGEWACEILEVRPDERIAWRGLAGPMGAGIVTFHPVGPHTTRLTYMAEIDAEGYLGMAAESLPVFELALLDDLRRFKERVERAGHASPSASYSRR